MADLVTATEYKTYAGISGSDLDTVIGVMIDIASVQIRRYCGRNLTTGFESASRTEVYDGNGYKELQLTEWPVTSITSVTQVLDDGSTSALASTNYRVEGATGRLVRLAARTGRFATSTWGEVSSPGWGWEPGWDDGFQNWSVVYTGGYSTIPDDLKFACYRLIDWMMGTRGTNPTLQSESLGSYSYSRMSASDDAEAKMLRQILGPFMQGRL